MPNHNLQLYCCDHCDHSTLGTDGSCELIDEDSCEANQLIASVVILFQQVELEFIPTFSERK